MVIIKINFKKYLYSKAKQKNVIITRPRRRSHQLHDACTRTVKRKKNNCNLTTIIVLLLLMHQSILILVSTITYKKSIMIPNDV